MSDSTILLLGVGVSGLLIAIAAAGLLLAWRSRPWAPPPVVPRRPAAGIDSTGSVRPVLSVSFSTGRRGRWRWYVSGPEGLIAMSPPAGYAARAAAVSAVRRIEAAALVFDDEVKGDGELKPSIGRIVHLHRKGFEPHPLIVTAVHGDDCVSGVAFSAEGVVPGFAKHGPGVAAAYTSIIRSSEPEGDGSEFWWDWPPRV